MWRVVVKIVVNYVVLAFLVVNYTMNNFRLPRGWLIYVAEQCLMCCTIQQGGKVWGRWAFHVMSLVEAQRIRPFHFYYVMLCADCRRLPTGVATWSWETKSHSHGPTGFPITWIAALFAFFLYSLLLVFEQFFFFFKAILVSHKNVTILPNRLWLVFRHLFFYYSCHMDSYDKNYDFFFI